MKKIGLVGIVTFCFFKLYSQEKFSVDFRDVNLKDAVEHLNEVYQFKFSYDEGLLAQYPLNRKINANSDAELVSFIFKGFPFKVQLAEGVYLVIPTKKKQVPVAGWVHDAASGNPLAFAYIQSNSGQTLSDQHGRFSLPPSFAYDSVDLFISYLGYKDLYIRVFPNERGLFLSLEQDPVVLEEVVLSTPLHSSLNQISFLSLNPKKIGSLPSLGETDVFKSLQLLPGVQGTDESASSLFVRGGLPSQNLVLFDGMTLYHLDHFFGIFSTLNPKTINNVSLYKGGFEAEYGGRVSSVIDVTGKAGSTESLSGSFGGNFLSYNGLIETPIGNRSSLLVGGRKSFTELIQSSLYKDFLSSSRDAYLETVDPAIGTYGPYPVLNFFDVNAKFRHRFNSNSILDINLYASDDQFQATTSDFDFYSELSLADNANWGNRAISGQWKSNFSSSWYGDMVLGFSEFSDNQTLFLTQDFYNDNIRYLVNANTRELEVISYQSEVSSGVSEFKFQSNHVIEKDSATTIKGGMEFLRSSTNFASEQLFLKIFKDTVSINDINRTDANTLSLYGSYGIHSEKISATVGGRLTYYQPNKTFYFEPRVNLGLHLNEFLTLKGATSLHYQFINHTSPTLFQDDSRFYWTLADGGIPVQKSIHLILGSEYSVKNWAIDFEYYQKHSEGVIENNFFPTGDGEGSPGKNNAYGLDLFIKYNNTNYSSWISYSLRRSTSEINHNGQNFRYSSVGDQRHELKLVNLIKIKKWEFSNVFIYGSGRPFTTPYLEGDTVTYDLEQLNKERLPYYLRMDLAANYLFQVGKFRCEAGFTAFNVLNRINIRSKRFVPRFVFDEGNGPWTVEGVELVALDNSLLGFTPNISLNISF